MFNSKFGYHYEKLAKYAMMKSNKGHQIDTLGFQKNCLCFYHFIFYSNYAYLYEDPWLKAIEKNYET